MVSNNVKSEKLDIPVRLNMAVVILVFVGITKFNSKDCLIGDVIVLLIVPSLNSVRLYSTKLVCPEVVLITILTSLTYKAAIL